MISKQEENKASLIAVISSFGITALLVLFLLWLTVHVKNPPFDPPIADAGGGGSTGPISVSIGTPDVNDKYTMPTSKAEVEPPSNSQNNIESNDGTNINEVKNPNNNEVKNPNKNNNQNTKNNNVSKWDKNLSNASNGASTGGTTGGPIGPVGPGIGNNPFNGPGTTGGSRPGVGDKGDLSGRKTVKMPCKVDDSDVEGTVVVTIKVNKNGDVIDADPNGSGTNTSNAVLKSKARQAAFCAKFEACSDCPDVSKGTVIFNFVSGGK